MENKLLLPLAVVQGLWLLQRTPRLPTPKGSYGSHGTDADVAVRVVGVGDSIMAGTGVTEQCHSLTATFARLLHERDGSDVAWRVHGANGATSAAVLRDLAPRAGCADIYIISVGVNDATRGVEPDSFAANLRSLFDLLRRKSPASVILFGGLPPLDCFPAMPWPLGAMLAYRARELQAVAAAVANRYERTLCFQFPPTVQAEQFASDGFHPAEVACERWAQGLLELWPSRVARKQDGTVRRRVLRAASHAAPASQHNGVAANDVRAALLLDAGIP